MGKAIKVKERQEQIDREVTTMPNSGLLEATIQAATGDDYDGCFTPWGTYEFGALKAELSRRLIECGFITTAIGEE